jgi:hypothetical protein
MILQIHRQFHVNWNLVHLKWPWSFAHVNSMGLWSFKCRQFHVNWSLVIWNDQRSPMLIQWGYDPSNPSSISCPAECGHWNYDPLAHVNSMNMILNPSSISCQRLGIWSDDPSPMLIQWGYDPSNPSSISCQLGLVHWNWPWSFAHVNSMGCSPSKSLDFMSIRGLVHWNWPWSFAM